MTPTPLPQPVLEADAVAKPPNSERLLRRVIAGPVALALLLAGGAALVRVAVFAAQSQGELYHPMLYTAVICVMAGVALVLVTLPKIVSGESRGNEPTPATQG